MEYIIAILLIVIIYYLYKLNQPKGESAGSSSIGGSQKSSRAITFTKEEWSEAVYNYKKTERIYNDMFYPTPGYMFGYDPGVDLPNYEEVKNKPHEYENLIFMTQKMKERIATEPPRKPYAK